MLCGCWQVSIATIGNTDDHGLRQRAALFEVESDFCECFKWDTTDPQITDADDLYFDIDRLGSGSGEHRSIGIGYGQSGKTVEFSLIRDFQNRFRSFELV